MPFPQTEASPITVSVGKSWWNQTRHDCGDERPIENLVDRRSSHKDKKGWRQGKVKNEAVEGCGRVRPKYPVVPRKITRQYDAKDRKDDIYKSVHGTNFPRELVAHRTLRTGKTRSDCSRTNERRCPLWVISRHMQCTTSCPLYPRKRHQIRHNGMSAKGYKPTCYSITSSAVASNCGCKF